VSETPVKIGLWGAPGSGKTAFLGALAIAVDKSGGTAGGRAGQSRSRVGSWSIWSRDDKSVDYLYQRKREMLVERLFPGGTGFGVTSQLSWGFAGHLAWSEFDKRPRLLRRKELLSNFELDLVDVQGAVYDRNPGQAEGADSAVSAAFEHLEHAQGLIYLFDPITERDTHDAIKYVDGTIEELKSRVYKHTGKFSRYLQHELSVCVTKFDHRKIYQRARDLNFVFDGQDGMPMVPDEHAERFFDAICTGDFWPERYEDNRERARLVRQCLCNSFEPDRIKYYVTSSIGFAEKDPSAPFDGDRFQANYIEGSENEESKIVGDVHPINVLEPLIRLQQRIARQRRR
jgi:hypothetical protein